MDAEPILKFLTDLSKNNNREWFESNKSRFLESKAIFEEIVQQFIDEIGKFDPGIASLEPKKCIFRIYRDVRFSKDKSPYKLNFGASMAEGGRKTANPGYYIHFKPKECFFGGGLYHPEAEDLKKVRQEIDYNASDFVKMVENKKFKDMFGDIWGEKLKRAPKGYEEEHPQIDYLKLKDFVLLHQVKDEVIKKGDFVREGVKSYKMIKPFNDFLKSALH